MCQLAVFKTQRALQGTAPNTRRTITNRATIHRSTSALYRRETETNERNHLSKDNPSSCGRAIMLYHFLEHKEGQNARFTPTLVGTNRYGIKERAQEVQGCHLETVVKKNPHSIGKHSLRILTFVKIILISTITTTFNVFSRIFFTIVELVTKCDWQSAQTLMFTL